MICYILLYLKVDMNKCVNIFSLKNNFELYNWCYELYLFLRDLLRLRILPNTQILALRIGNVV